MVNYWDMSTLSDEIGGINLCDGLNYNFTKNRFNSPYQAIRLSNGYLKFDQYPQLSTEFSITAWLKVNSNKARMEFLYFSDSNLEKNSVKIDFIDSLLHFEKTNPNLDVKSPIVVDSGAWHHLTVVVDYNRVNIYINGLMVAQKDYRSNTKNNESFMLLKYIGKTNENNYKNYADLSLDELKIFDGALKSFEVYKEFLKNGKDIFLLFILFGKKMQILFLIQRKWRPGTIKSPSNGLA